MECSLLVGGAQAAGVGDRVGDGPRVATVGLLPDHLVGALGQRYLLWKVAWPMPARARLARPSRRSSLIMMVGPSARVTRSAAATPPERQACSARLVTACARVGPFARFWAKALPSSVRRSAGTTRLMRPQDASVCGGRTTPVNTISAAREAPIRDAMRWVPPAYGMLPATASIWPIWLASAAQMRSQARHTSRAPA